MSENTENHDLIVTAQEAVSPYAVEHGDGSGIYIVRDTDGETRAMDLRDKLGLLPAHPDRKTGNVTLTEPVHFVGYLQKHAEPWTEVFYNDRDCTIKAVINAHGDAPGYGDHTAVLAMRQSQDWTEWTNTDGKLLEQAMFAEFIEDHLPNFAAPSGADMLELAQTFQATTKVDFASSQRVKSGETQLLYKEDTSATAGRKGSIPIPDTFELGLPVFEGGQLYKVGARFRYRIRDGKLHLGYRLTRPRDIVRDAFGQVVQDVSAGVESDLWAV